MIQIADAIEISEEKEEHAHTTRKKKHHVWKLKINVVSYFLSSQQEILPGSVQEKQPSAYPSLSQKQVERIALPR